MEQHDGSPWGIIILLILVLALAFAKSVSAASPTREARASSIVYQIRSMERVIAWLKEKACLAGVEEFCKEQPLPEVSPDHTKLISLTVMASVYNPMKSQTDDSPCEGAWGNVCEAYERGENPIAISRDLVPYPLNKGNKLKITEIIGKSCSEFWPAMKDKTYTIMDTLSDCLEKNKDKRTNRCMKPIEDSIDILLPCEGTPGSPDYCLLSKAQARATGVCHVTLTQL